MFYSLKTTDGKELCNIEEIIPEMRKQFVNLFEVQPIDENSVKFFLRNPTKVCSKDTAALLLNDISGD